jgi:superfamily II DNA or RNA helicase
MTLSSSSSSGAAFRAHAPTPISRRTGADPLVRALRTATRPEPERTKAYEMLVGLAGRRAEPVPAAALAGHVLRIHAADGWPVQRAAFEAAMERLAEAQRDELRVQARPDGALGRYAVRRKGRGGALPWTVWLSSVDPLRASCDCPDHLRNGLGLCAHVWTAWADVAARPRVWARAKDAEPHVPALDWDPVRPLLGTAPWWMRLRFRPPGRLPAFARGWRARGDGSLSPRPGRGPERWAADALAYARRAPDRVSPAVRALLAEARAQERAPVLRSALDRVLRSLRQPLFPHQRDGVARLVESERLLLADDMGLGKTAQAVAACHALHRLGRVRRGLLVVPAALQPQWLREWTKVTDLPARVVDDAPARRRARYRETREGFLIVSYEILLRDADALRRWAPDLVVLDEAQRIKNASTRTARTVKSLQPRYRLALTGTPLENRLPELASLLEWVDDRALAPEWRLPVVHGGVGYAAHLDSLRARIAHCFLRRRRAEILEDLPPRTDTTLGVGMTSAQRREHGALDRRIARLVHISRRRPLTPSEQLRLIALLTRQRIVANGMAQHDFESIWPGLEGEPPDEARLGSLSTPKLVELRGLLRRLVLEEGRRVVVFSQWVRMLRLADWATRDLLEEAGLRAVFFTGKSSPKARDRSVVELHDDPETRVLFASDAGGVGLNLQRAATACVNLELPWNPAVLEQRVARIHRLGQDAPVSVYNLVTEGSIEARIESLVGAKRALFEGLFDDERDSVVLHDASLVERLRAQSGPAGGPPGAHVEHAPPTATDAALVSTVETASADAPPEGAATEITGNDGTSSGEPPSEPRANENRADENRADDERADDERANENRADENRADENRADEDRADEDGANAGACAAAGGRASEEVANEGDTGPAAVGEAAATADLSRPSASGEPSLDADGEHAGAGERAPSDADGNGPASVRRLLRAVRVTPRPDGGVTIEAPGEVAEDLAAVFRTMAQLVAPKALAS